MQYLKILVCGDRNWDDCSRVRQVIGDMVEKIKPIKVTIIEGEAQGADTCGRLVAEADGYELMAFPAEWHKYGKIAGPIRNAKQLKEGDPDIVIAFHDDIEQSKGTFDMINKSVLANKPTVLVTSTEIRWWGKEFPAFPL